MEVEFRKASIGIVPTELYGTLNGDSVGCGSRSEMFSSREKQPREDGPRAWHLLER